MSNQLNTVSYQLRASTDSTFAEFLVTYCMCEVA